MVDEEQTEDSGTTTPSSPVSAETLSAGLTPANQVGSKFIWEGIIILSLHN